MVNPAAVIGKAFTSKEGLKAIKMFSESMVSMQDIAKTGGFTDMKGMFESAQSMMGSPLIIPMQILIAEIAAGTADETVKLMNTMLENMDKPGAKAALALLIDFFNAVLKGAGVIAEGVSALTETLFGEDAQTASGRLEDIMSGHYDPFGGNTYTPLGPTGTATTVYFDPNDPRTHGGRFVSW